MIDQKDKQLFCKFKPFWKLLHYLIYTVHELDEDWPYLTAVAMQSSQKLVAKIAPLRLDQTNKTSDGPIEGI